MPASGMDIKLNTIPAQNAERALNAQAYNIKE
jgi:hypothetical protein